jgi:hypothetical protein
MRDTTYWRERLILDDLASAYAGLVALEIATVGEPKHFPFHNAADKLFVLEVELREQVEAASRNSYYQQKQRD